MRTREVRSKSRKSLGISHGIVPERKCHYQGNVITVLSLVLLMDLSILGKD